MHTNNTSAAVQIEMPFFYCVKDFNIFSGSEFRLSLTQNPDYKDLKRLNESYITLRADHLSSVSCHFDPG